MSQNFATLNLEPALLVADFGDPGFPFWRLILALLLLAQVALALSADAGDMIIRRPVRTRSKVERVIRSGGRTGQRVKPGRPGGRSGRPNTAKREQAA